MADRFTPGIKDEMFIRDKVPMTKEEVREVSLCKLNLSADSILYDIGSGTGSIAVEAASLSKKIQVFAIETKKEALELITRNKEKFDCSNIQIIHALAPDGMEELPSPTHAFIGGTKGNIKSILDELYKKNQKMRIVMTAVSLESICQMQEVLKSYRIENDEVIQISVSKACKIGDYHLLQANNPVFVFSFNFTSS